MSKTKGRADLLVEVGTEELPPAALRKLSEAFASGLAEALATAGLVESPTPTPFARGHGQVSAQSRLVVNGVNC